MIRKIVVATVSTALVAASFTPAMAQDNRYGVGDAPLGATATANFRIPFGVAKEKAIPNYGLTLGFGRTVGSEMLGGRTKSRAVTLADLRFTGAGLQKAEVASFNLAEPRKDRRLNMMDDGDSTLWIVGGIIVLGLGICLLAECFEDDDDEDDDPQVNPL